MFTCYIRRMYVLYAGFGSGSGDGGGVGCTT